MVSGDAGTLDNGNTFTVTFTGVYGDVPLLTAVPASKMTITSTTEGAAPYRKEIQAFSCTAGATGNLLINWRGIGEVTVATTDDLATLESDLSAGLTAVTVAGIDASAVCTGKLVYVTFEDVSCFNPSVPLATPTHVDFGRIQEPTKSHGVPRELP